MIHDDILRDVVREVGARAPRPQSVDEGVQRMAVQAASVLRSELYGRMCRRFLVVGMESPQAGMTQAQWQIFRAGQASVLEWMAILAAQGVDNA